MEPARKLEPLTVVGGKEDKGFLARLGSVKIGVVPLPLYIIIAAVILASAHYKMLPADMIGGFAIIMVMGIFFGEVGMRIPILKDIGGPAILALLVPSILVYLNVF